MMHFSLLKKEHVENRFDCGVPALNSFFEKHALQSQASNVSRTYVLSDEKNRVIGYYSLVYGSVSASEVTERIRAGTGRYPIPTIIIARLAVDQRYQGQGFGKAILKDAILRCIQASEIAGLRAIVVNAKDEKSKIFYEKYGFMPSPLDEFHLFLLMKDVLKSEAPKNSLTHKIF
jgi:GNAT superfamily N-acetyltransferase